MSFSDYLPYIPIFILLVAITSLLYNIFLNTRKPKIELQIGVPRPDLDDPSTPLIRRKGKMSDEFEFIVNILNYGTKEAKSIFLTMVFNKGVQVLRWPDDDTWISSDLGIEFKVFKYSTDKNLWPKDLTRRIGVFKLAIPFISNHPEYLLLNGTIKGDFSEKTFLVAYNYEDEQFYIRHYSGKDINQGNHVWNARLLAQQSQKSKEKPNELKS